jgi:hypothetical protein
MSGDSELSASELQRRYHKGGTVQDDELTAAQLRARHGIAGNRAGTTQIRYIFYRNMDSYIF